jgi:hypothetical protein
LNLPSRTYFRYLSQPFEHDWQVLKQENDDAGTLALQISILKDTFRTIERALHEIMNSPKDPMQTTLKTLIYAGASSLNSEKKDCTSRFA